MVWKRNNNMDSVFMTGEPFCCRYNFLGGGGSPDIVMPDNSAMMKWMAQRDDRNNDLYAQRQADIMSMEQERIDMEQAGRLNIQREEQQLLAEAEHMEDIAQEEATAQYGEEDIDNIITGFYGSLYGNDSRPD